MEGKKKPDYPFKSKANANKEESKSPLAPSAELMPLPESKLPDGPDASESVLED